jgi:hypothetical protein
MRTLNIAQSLMLTLNTLVVTSYGYLTPITTTRKQNPVGWIHETFTTLFPDFTVSEKLAFVSGPFSLRSPQALINFVNYPLTDHRFRFGQFAKFLNLSSHKRLGMLYPST